MADLEKTVAIIFQGKDDLSKDLKSLDTNLRGFGKSVGDMAAPFADLGKTILIVEAALIALVTGAMAMAINKAGEFGGSFKEISTLIDASGTDIAGFREDVLKYAQDSGKSIADINQAIYKAVSAGINYKDVLAELSTAEKLSIAGRNDLASTTVLLAGTMNAYGAKAEEAGHYSDVFMETVRRGLTTLPELAGSLANVTGIASMGKVPIETLSAAIAALTATGIPTEQAITGMKNVIANIIKPTKEAADMAATLGIEFNATALKTRGLEAVLWDAWRATGGSAEQMNTLFGSIRGLNAATVLASDSSGRFKDALIAMQSVAGTTDAAYAKMAKGFGETNQNLKNNIDVLLIDIGTRFLPTYGEIGRGLSDVFKGVKIGIDSGTFAPVFEYLNAFGIRIAGDLREIAKNVPEAMKNIDMSALIASFDKLGSAVAKAFAAIFGSIDLTTATGLEIFLQKLIDGFRVLTDITTGIVGGLNPFFRILGEGLTTFSSIGGETAELVGHFLGLAMGVQKLADAFEIFVAILSLRGITGMLAFSGSVITAAKGVGTMVAAMSASELGMLGLAAGVGVLIGTWLNQFEVVEKVSQSILKLIDTQGNYFGALDKSKSQMAEIDRKYEEAIAVHKRLAAAQGESADSLDKTGESAKTAKSAMSDIYIELDKVAKTVMSEKKVSIKAEADGKSIIEVDQVLDKAFTETPKTAKVIVDIEITKIKEQSAVIQKSMEWTAKVNLADAEQATKRLKDMMDSVGTGIKSTGDLIGSLFGSLEKASNWTKADIKDQIKLENERRTQEFDLQKKLIGQQIELNDLKIKRMRDGNFKIEIAAAGLQPHLTMILWEILTAIQLKANTEASEFLLGMA